MAESSHAERKRTGDSPSPEPESKPKSSIRPDGFPEPWVVEPYVEHTHTMIMLHDFHSSGQALCHKIQNAQQEDYADVFDSTPNWRWVFPTAKKRPNMPRYWFEPEYDESGPEKEVLAESIQYIHRIIEEELDIIEQNPDVGNIYVRIMLGGIHQGAALALLVSMSSFIRFSGLVLLSGWMEYRTILERLADEDTPLEGEEPGQADKFVRVRDFFKDKLGVESGYEPDDYDFPVLTSECEYDAWSPAGAGEAMDYALGEYFDMPNVRKVQGGIGDALKLPGGVTHLMEFLTYCEERLW